MKNDQPRPVEELVPAGKEQAQSPMRLFLFIFVAPIALIVVLMAIMNLLD